MAQKILEPAAGGLLVDASCGSGLFSRRFANCGLYSGVVALDFSENMLRQCYEFIKQDKALSTAYGIITHSCTLNRMWHSGKRTHLFFYPWL
jgi:ubiquinone/menaquinone biosynthesis C-methylase UbiE